MACPVTKGGILVVCWTGVMAVGLGLKSYTYHLLNRLNRKGSYRCLGAQHHSVGPIKNSIGYISHLSPGRTGIHHHRFEHLCGNDDGQAQFVTPGDNALLYQWHLSQGHLNAQVTSCYHYAISYFQDLIKMFNRLRLLYFGDERDVPTSFFPIHLCRIAPDKLPGLVYILWPAHKAQCHIINAMCDTK